MFFHSKPYTHFPARPARKVVPCTPSANSPAHESGAIARRERT
jgi:hypothetical protein